MKQNFLQIDKHNIDTDAVSFCKAFLNSNCPKYVLGRNEYAESIARAVSIDGFIDEFTDDKFYLSKPVLKVENLPKNSIVVVAVVGRPFSARKNLIRHKIRNVDYFSFKKYAEIDIIDVLLWNNFEKDFEINRDRYEWVSTILRDQVSKNIYNRIINFRLSGKLDYMSVFTDIQYRQYFEDFLGLHTKGEVFMDVGAFDGFTSIEFVKHCPNYKAIHMFEPDPNNMKLLKSNLSEYRNISFYTYGLADQEGFLSFKTRGSSSRIIEQGDISIKVRPLDVFFKNSFSFMKMDIEGHKLKAIKGARKKIIECHPILAISVYHRHDDLWKIPDAILSIRDDYHVFLRHYIEGASETIMFFVPK
jgi:FkbM family methyltransferase